MNIFLDVLTLLGALGLFIYGMKVMSEGIQKVAGDRLRSIIELMTSNRVSGVFTGFLTTSIIQSSSATTVMVVSFVNAGLLKLKQAIGVIMGANIGTTVTALLILLFGFSKFSISTYTLPIIAIGFPLLFAKSDKLKYWAEFLIGFAILFMGLDFLKESVPDLKDNPDVLEWITNLTSYGYGSVILFVLIGTLLTIVVQSSSAAMAITLILCDNGWIPFEMAAAIILGENIGTTITANLAAIVANVHAKRAARAHLMFNIFGVAWMLIAYYFYLDAIDWATQRLHDYGSPFTETKAVKYALAYFHVSFNILNTFVMIWFVDRIERMVVKLVPDKNKEGESSFKLQYIGTEISRTADLAIVEARKEVHRYAEIVEKMWVTVKEMLYENDTKVSAQLQKKIEEDEEVTDKLEEEVAKYLVQLAEGRLSTAVSLQMSSLLTIVKDLERIGDIILRLSQDIERRNRKEFEFTEEQVDDLRKMIAVLDEAIKIMLTNLSDDYDKANLDEARNKEVEINKLKKKLQKKHFKAIASNEYEVKSGIVYRDVFFGFEKMGDHIINVSENIAGNMGKDEEDM
ncbi:MAG: Na/Pi cotransporter family protein [Bacteroidota bacterium]